MIHLVDSYGEAIEVDLHERFGLDLLDFFRGKYSWRKLLVLIHGLPMASAFMAAQLDDDEVGEAIAGQPVRPGRNSPSLRDFTPEVAALTNVIDRLGDMITAIVAVNGGKPPQIDAMPRPVTSVDRANVRKAAKRHYDLVSEVAEAQARWVAARAN